MSRGSCSVFLLPPFSPISWTTSNTIWQRVPVCMSQANVCTLVAPGRSSSTRQPKSRWPQYCAMHSARRTLGPRMSVPPRARCRQVEPRPARSRTGCLPLLSSSCCLLQFREAGVHVLRLGHAVRLARDLLALQLHLGVGEDQARGVAHLVEQVRLRALG